MTAGASLTRLEGIATAVRARAPQVAARDLPFYEAAVALILRVNARDVLELLFIKRTIRDDDPWSGQIALPGGRRDAGDASLEDTAVRETMEEVGVDIRAHGTLVGALDEIRPRLSLLPPVIVRPFVATVASPRAAQAMAREWAPANAEVAEAFWAPLDEILSRDATRDTEIAVRGHTVRRSAIHYRGHVIWGMTEGIVRTFAETIG